MRVLLVVVGVSVILYLVHRLLLIADERGMVFYKTRPPRVRMLGFLEELVDPRAEYTVEHESAEVIRADQAESGEGTRGVQN